MRALAFMTAFVCALSAKLCCFLLCRPYCREARKGWDVLLGAYLTAFSAQVCRTAFRACVAMCLLH